MRLYLREASIINIKIVMGMIVRWHVFMIVSHSLILNS